MRHFNAGDLVEAIDFEGASGRELERGRVYEVRLGSNKDRECLFLEGISDGFFPSRFKLSEKKLETPEKTTALQTQVGGSHYTDMKIQPIEYILANNIPFPEGNVIKYVSRWRNKGGLKDVKKALHHLQLLIEHEEEKGTE